MDEQWLIIANEEYLKSWQSLRDAFTSSLYSLYYRPLLLVSIVLDYRIGGLSPLIYHITNLCWHLAAVFSLFKLLNVFKVPRQNAALLCLLFSIHPIMLHAVAWVPGRNDVMLCVFTLNSIIYLRKYISENKTKYSIWFIFFYLSALLTKENAVALPLLYLVIIYKEMPAKKGVVLISVLAGCTVAWLLVRNAIVPEISTSSMSFTQRTVSFFESFLFYLGKNIFPANQSVFPTIHTGGIVSGIVGVLFICGLWYKNALNNYKTSLTGILLFGVLLILPLWFSSGKYNGELFEHRSYTSACGLILFISQVKINFYSKKVISIMGLIFILFFINTLMRMDVYRDKKSFLKQGIKEQPSYYLFQVQYAGFLENEGNYSLAIEYYNSAIKLRPDKHLVYNHRGRAHCALGQFDLAIKDINSAMQISGFNKDYCLNRCIVFDSMGDTENAMKDMITLMSCCKQIVPPELSESVRIKWKNELDKLSQQIITQTNNAGLLGKRAKMYFETGQKEKAFKDIEEAIKKDPKNEEFKKLYFEILL